VDRGWLRLWRKLSDSPIWNAKPFSPGQAWVDLLLRATHKTSRVKIGNAIVPVPRGGVLTSITKLTDRWGWGRGKVHRFLKFLEEDDSIAVEWGDQRRKYTLLTVLKWDEYQHPEGYPAGETRNSSGTGPERDVRYSSDMEQPEAGPRIYDSSNTGGGTVPEDREPCGCGTEADTFKKNKQGEGSPSTSPLGSPPPPPPADGNGRTIQDGIEAFAKSVPFLRVPDPSKLAGRILNGYQAAEGDDWIEAQLADVWRWCQANAKKAAAYRDPYRFVLNWLRRASKARAEGRGVFEKTERRDQGPRWRDPRQKVVGLKSRGISGTEGTDGD